MGLVQPVGEWATESQRHQKKQRGHASPGSPVDQTECLVFRMIHVNTTNDPKKLQHTPISHTPGTPRFANYERNLDL